MWRDVEKVYGQIKEKELITQIIQTLAESVEKYFDWATETEDQEWDFSRFFEVPFIADRSGKYISVCDITLRNAFFEPLLKHSDLVAVCRAPELTHPGIPHPLRVLDGSRMLQHTAWLRAICKKFGAVFLCGNGKADDVFCHRNGGVAHQPVKAKPRDAQYIRRLHPS